MAYGAAESREEIPSYLKDIRGGRPVPDPLLEEVVRRYQVIGGRSPLIDITRRQAAALQAALGKDFAVYVGMWHSEPRIASVAARIAGDGHKTVIGFPLTPYESKLSTGAYLEKLERAAEGLNLEVRRVDSWYKHPRLIEAFVERISEALERIPKELRAETSLLMSAHNLPERVVVEGDPYARQLQETAKAVASGAGFNEFRFAYQSKGGSSGEKWLGPEAGESIEALAKKGVKSLLLSPIGFVCEHLETLYDDDVLYREQAERLGMHFARAAAPNESAHLIAALTDIVRSVKVPG